MSLDTMMKLGTRQRGVLRSLLSYGPYKTSGISGWHWTTPGATVEICESLVKRGLAERHGNEFRISDAGRTWMAHRNQRLAC